MQCIKNIQNIKSPADKVSLGVFLCYSPNLDTETEAAYDNYKKLWLKIEHIMVSRDNYKQKNEDLSRTEHTHY